MEHNYHAFEQNSEQRKTFYYTQRNLFNTRSLDELTQAALFIFLNRTCFNGLYRVNSKNQFNVPQGSYKNPKICHADNLTEVSKALQNVEILNGDYRETIGYACQNSFFYFDPPYKPLSNTSSFNAYAKDIFDDESQIQLKIFCDDITQMGSQWVLSNSDVKGINPNDDFFDDLYKDYNIARVFAKRTINSNANKRGKLTELLISNML
jgi:DNA adenine methylase